MTERRFDIWPVLEQHGWSLPNPRGGWQSVKCGEHGDSHASARINFDIGRVKCLACDFGGDAIDVIKYYEGLGYRDAVRRCEEITGGGDSDVPRSGRTRSGVSSGSRYSSRSSVYTPSRLRSGPYDRA